MFIGLGLTGFIAYYISGNEAISRMIIANRAVFCVLIIAELGLVFSISGMINKMSAATATGLFVLYSALNGATLSFIFLIYTASSIASTFFICSATFLACSIYGWATKARPHIPGRIFHDGIIRDHYCFTGKYVYQKQRNEHDNKLYRRSGICRAYGI